eukprot:5028767-Prorocentrum_lima.AAC.1
MSTTLSKLMLKSMVLLMTLSINSTMGVVVVAIVQQDEVETKVQQDTNKRGRCCEMFSRCHGQQT